MNNNLYPVRHRRPQTKSWADSAIAIIAAVIFTVVIAASFAAGIAFFLKQL